MRSSFRELADLRPGDHACLLYNDLSELLAVVVPYLRDGLARKERCLYVGDESVTDVEAGLRQAGLDVHGQTRRGGLVLLTRRDDQAAGELDPGARLQFLRDHVQHAVDAGFTGVRIATDIAWTPGARVPPAGLIEYEARLNTDFFSATGVSVICLYHRARFPGALLRDALHVHPLVVSGGRIGPNLRYTPRAEGPAPGAPSSIDWLLAEVSRAQAVGRTLKALLDTAPLPVIGLDLDHTVMFWNPAAERLFGWREDEVIGRALPTMPEGLRDETAKIRDAVGAGRTLSGLETQRRRRDGALLEVALSVAPLRAADGAVLGMVGIVVDITERKIAERQLAGANRIKDEFLATLSHELRTPLNSVMGWTRILLTREVDADTRRKALETIARNADAQVRLVNDLLDISRIVRGDPKLDLQPVDLVKIADAAREAIHPTADAKGIRIELAHPTPAAVVAGDAARLQQVVWNLLSNAVKFTPPGGRVTVDVAVEGPLVRLGVTDTGQGIEPDFLPRVFARFSRQDGSTTRPHGGLGIGLAVVRHIVELHGGTVSAHSDGPGTGATFTVRLRRAESR